MKDNRKIIQVLTILTIIFTVMGGSLAYWNWTTDTNQSTKVVFKTGADFSCSADGGGNITQNDAKLVPTTCTDSEFAAANPDAIPRVIKREVTSYIEIDKSGINVKLNLWLKVNSLDPALSASDNLRYILTTSSSSCSEGTILSSGNFKGLEQNDTVDILNNKVYSATTTDKYYLYIWLDKEETNSNTMNKSFSFSLGGECTDTPQPEKPVLDTNGMIPVKIDENGDVFTVSSDDASWYNYENQEWANAVLVSNNRSTYLNNLSNNVQVAEDDILAYYVWIPRYKYRIPYTKCSEIPEADRNMEDYPECYAPYTMSPTDKNKLAAYYEGENYCAESEESMSEALTLVNYALQNGKFLYTYYNRLSIVSWVEAYNNGESNDCGSTDGTQLTITPSEFSGNNRLYGAGNEVSIDIEFESVNDSLSKGDAVNTYYTHPAFTWDGEAVSGIWVGKFETTPDKNDTCYTTPNDTNCNDTTQNPTILPNESPLRYQYIGNQFTTSQNFTKSGNVYGLSNGTTDGHMMKNSEWGAVAYLSHSTYGINKEITINNYYNSSDKEYKTGCGALEGVTSSSNTCTNAYSTDGLTTYPQSTTGNITGVFDISGGTWEYVMGNYNNVIYEDYVAELPDSKYYDMYPESQFNRYFYGNMVLCTLETCGGHALLETAGWYNDYAYFVSSDYPWFGRGGSAGDGSDAGAFLSNDNGGGHNSYYSWRSVLVVADGV